MKRTYEVVSDESADLSVWIEVDLDVLTPDLATEINSFWAGAQDVLEAADGDVVEAVVLWAASAFMRSVLAGLDIRDSQNDLDAREGWPPNGEHGIRLVDYSIPDVSAVYLSIHDRQVIGSAP